MNVRRTLFLAILALCATTAALAPRTGSATAVPDWKAEFADICAHTGNATELSKDDLRSLIARCRKLEPALQKLGETERKVYMWRLEMCRELYEYVLKSKEAEEAPPATH